MATTETAYRVLSLPQEAREGDDDRVFIRLRRTLDIGAFGAGATYQAKAGEEVIGEHDELGPGADGHEELYVVVQGSATFSLDGEEVDAPQGTVVFVQPERSGKRSRRATRPSSSPSAAVVARLTGFRRERSSSTSSSTTTSRTTKARSPHAMWRSRSSPGTR